jgi:hypothetical protein
MGIMIGALAYLASASSGVSESEILSTLVTWGPGGVFLALILFGVVEPKRAVTTATSDRDRWQEAFVKEQEAHQKTREALAKAEERAEASTEAAKTTAALLEELGHRRTRQQRSN